MKCLKSAVLGALSCFLLMATSASAASPAQISYSAAKVMVGGPFIHGDNVRIDVNVRYTRKRPTTVFTGADCSGASVPLPIGLYVFTPNGADIFDCAGRPVYHPRHPIAASRRRMAARRVCRHVSAVANKFQAKHQRVRISCKYLARATGDARSIVLWYRNQKGRRYKMRRVELTHMKYPGSEVLIPQLGEITIDWRHHRAKSKYPNRILIP